MPSALNNNFFNFDYPDVMKLSFLTVTALLAVSVLGCRKDVKIDDETQALRQYLRLPEEPYNYARPQVPKHFYEQFVLIQDNTPDSNIITDWGATLGRVLFYDKRLSANGSVSCASCHQQRFGFTDTAQFSTGFMGGLTPRHSMSLVNARYYLNGRFFWDERAETLEEQVLHPIQDPLEMGMSLDAVTQRLASTPFYPILFERAFGSAEITSDKMSRALAQFIRSIVSYRSRYDQELEKVGNRLMPFPGFSAAENLGKTIFFTNKKINCSGCHTTDLFVLDNARNTGLHTVSKDLGLATHTNNPEDIGKFKTPSLRLAALRGRFMHDGSILGLRNVVEHYNKGIQQNPNLDSHLIADGQPIRMELTPEEVDAVVAFLATLNDEALLSDEKYADPFRR